MNTIVSEAAGFYKVSSSKFFSVAFPCASKEEMDDRRNDFRKEHASATHICYAYRFAKPETVFSTDAGEPKGTAGKPLLNLLLKHHFTDTAILVARYYGGKKLGVPGLIEAYTRAGENALLSAERKAYIPVKQTVIKVPFHLINEVYILAKKFNATVKIVENGHPAVMHVSAEEELFDSFEKELRRSKILHSSC